MKAIVHTITPDGLEKSTPFQGRHDIEENKNYWLEIKSDDRGEVAAFLDDFDFTQRLIEQVEDPGLTTRVNIYKDSLLVNLVVSDSGNIYKPAYLSIIIKNQLVITVLNESSRIFEDLKAEVDSNLFEFDLNLYHVVYYMLGEVVQQGMENLNVVRRRIQQLSVQVDEESDRVPLSDITRCKREVSQLTNIIEDQFTMLGFIPKVNWNGGSDQIRSELIELIQSLSHLQNSYERQEEKAEAIHNQYQLILQEKGNKRLNTLTVVQSIFVPLTFIAGIYGMNFVFMPELEWRYSYFVVWGLMLFITVFQLRWFKKRGWFD